MKHKSPFITKLLLIIVLSVLSFRNVYANDEVTFTASAENTVAVGETFQLVYTLNTAGKDLRLPSLDAFDVVAGPYTSTSSSMQYINGNMTSSKTVRYTYTLIAKKEGSFTISPASIIAKKDKHFSNAVKVKVIAAEDKAASTANNSNASAASSSTSSTNLSKDNLFVKATASRTKIKEQEAVLLSYKIYTRVDLVDIQSPKFPELKGLLVQEIDPNKNIQTDRENINGKIYITYLIKQYLVFPQKSGEFEIPPFSCNAIVRIRQRRQSRSIFDDFFDSYQDVSKSLSSNKIKLNVEALPEPKPANYSGVVGSFKMNSSISETELKTHESLTIKLTISGKGNLKLINNPKIEYPTDFEAYEPKVSNNFTTTVNGVTGTKTIEYLAIPRHHGNYTIKPIEFVYFDTDKNQYVTLSTDEYNVKVLKGEESDATVAVQSAANQEMVKVLASDIRYISTDNCELKKRPPFFAGSLAFWLIYVISILVATAFVVLFRKQVKENANLSLMRTKRANKVANKRLKIAKTEMQKGNKTVFYDEILKALWGYLCDKFSMPISQLSKENVAEELAARAVSQEGIDKFISLLNDCEFERYAPLANSSAAMDNIYNTTIEVISELENSIKAKARK